MFCAPSKVFHALFDKLLKRVFSAFSIFHKLISRYVNALDNTINKLLIFGDICFLLHKNYTNR